MLFSLIIPVYNVEKYLLDCLSSIANQLYGEFEAIVVDDGSTDSSGFICDEFAKKDSRFHVIHKTNGGVVAARHAAITASIGKYIVCVDSDDYISNNYLSEFKKIIELYSPDIVCCNHYVVNREKKVVSSLSYRYGFYNRSDMIKDIFPSLICSKTGRSFSSHLWAKAFKKSLFESCYLKDGQVIMGEDVACTKPTISAACSLYITDLPLYFYRDNPYSITKKKVVFPWDGIRIRIEHMWKKVSRNDYDFRDQIYRDASLSIFTVARSRFNDRTKTRSDIKNEISSNLNNQYFKNIITSAKFTNMKKKLMVFSLKHKWLWFLELYNKRKK